MSDRVARRLFDTFSRSRGNGKRAEKTGETPGNEGRFEGYDVLAQSKYWDDHTREVVFERMQSAAEAKAHIFEKLQFFTKDEGRVAEALVDQLLAQFEEPKVPVLHLIDQRLAKGEGDGWRYEDLPEDGDAWRQSLAALDEDAKARYKKRFADVTREEQAELIADMQTSERWHGWSSSRMWSLWTRYACSAFYGHPWAWNEIGFGGPAYPRGYKVLRQGWLEPWEKPEVDATDPVPWAERVEAARNKHEKLLPPPETEDQPESDGQAK